MQIPIHQGSHPTSLPDPSSPPPESEPEQRHQPPAEVRLFPPPLLPELSPEPESVSQGTQENRGQPSPRPLTLMRLKVWAAGEWLGQLRRRWWSLRSSCPASFAAVQVAEAEVVPRREAAEIQLSVTILLELRFPANIV